MSNYLKRISSVEAGLNKLFPDEYIPYIILKGEKILFRPGMKGAGAYVNLCFGVGELKIENENILKEYPNLKQKDITKTFEKNIRDIEQFFKNI
jgi:uncharacterized protein (DUF433 family)